MLQLRHRNFFFLNFLEGGCLLQLFKLDTFNSYLKFTFVSALTESILNLEVILNSVIGAADAKPHILM